MSNFSNDDQFIPQSTINSNDFSGLGGKYIDQYASRFSIKMDKDWTQRQCSLYILKLFYHGEIYNNLMPWWVEYLGGGGQYVPLLRRRPAIIYNLPKIIVNKSSSLLFSSEHFPTVRCEEDNKISDFLQYVTRKGKFRNAMLAAARLGALGSVCIVVKLLNKRFHLDVIGSFHLQPIFDPQSPGKLTELYEKRKVDGQTLQQMGYEISAENKNKPYYFARRWDNKREVYYIPWLCEDEEKEKFSPSEDLKKSSEHNWGFVPAIWIKNSSECHHIDGECTFGSVLDTCIALDYQLSQLDRLLRYNSDPTMVIKDTANLGGEQIIKGGGNALMLGKDGDAYLMETTGKSTQSVIDFCRLLREFALEVLRGDRSNPDKMNTVHSGKALQMLQSALISLVDELRLCYGDNGLLMIYEMILQMCASDEYEVDFGKNPLPENYLDADLSLDWPDWYPPTPQDDLQKSQSVVTLKTAGIISKETATTSVAEEYGIQDIDKELKEIETQEEKEAKDSLAQASVVRTKPNSAGMPKDKKNEQRRNKVRK